VPLPPPLTWADVATRRAAVWGWGIEGHVAWKRLQTLGCEAVVVDDEPPGEVRTGKGYRAADDTATVLPLRGDGWAALQASEVVVKSPGVTRYRPEVGELERHGVPVVGGLGLWLEEVDRDRVVCITGTKGKSTTVAIMGHLLTGLGQRAFVGGNLGIPPYASEAPGDVDWWVVETSSYQVTDCWSAPPVVGVTSLHPDHLDWHENAERYYADKLSLCRLPGAALTVANGSDPRLRARGSQLGPRVDWVEPPASAPPWLKALGLLGAHNATNALIARGCLVAAGVPGADDDAAMTAAAAGFGGLPSRLRPVGSVGGVEFVDDALSTNVLPTLAALEAYPDRRVALIAGGFDRGLDYRPLADGLRRRSEPTLLLTVPDVGRRIGETVRDEGLPPNVAVEDHDQEDDAVIAGFDWARPDGVVLLSPAAPSYGHFQDYRQRSAAFAAAMRRCAGRS
jgi:UDP-N-acetylmuramoyl-L-alanine---L-glutamate ligase